MNYSTTNKILKVPSISTKPPKTHRRIKTQPFNYAKQITIQPYHIENTSDCSQAEIIAYRPDVSKFKIEHPSNASL